ncbi:MAG: hypothetical protein ACK2UF_14705 [Candidatus Promineifilaceae bacterium]|jgi:uncharacterized membrane protein YdbT with pleckstrin-like domain
MKMTENLLYAERITSKRTGILFVALLLLFFMLLIWQVTARGLDIFAAVLLCLCAFFFFCALNYQRLTIRLTTKSLKLTFGIFTWTVPLDNIEACCLDEIPVLMRFGGAGVHFMLIRRRYRASFNFLEYPRVVIALKRKVGPVRDISFSTRHPDELLRYIQEAIAANRVAHQGYSDPSVQMALE